MDLLIEILNFVNDNYLKFAIGLVLTLMAIIGYYAEKTNFGNKLNVDNKSGDDDSNKNIKNVGINDLVDHNIEQNSVLPTESNEDASIVETEKLNKNVENNSNLLINNETQDSIETKNQNDEKKSDLLINNETQSSVETGNQNDEKKEDNNNLQSNGYVDEVNNRSDETKINDESNIRINSENIFSSNESIDNDLLSDINNMTLDPLKEKNDNKKREDALARLNSNIDLPNIDDLKSDTDIWKF